MSQIHDHIVKSYDEEQRRLLDDVLRMGTIAAAQLEAALDVVERRDDKAAERIVANDEAIDAIEHEIDHGVMRLALRGPMARDLRTIFAALKVSADIERIGDYAANIALPTTSSSARCHGRASPHPTGCSTTAMWWRSGSSAASTCMMGSAARCRRLPPA